MTQILSSWNKYEWNNSSDALTNWLNARWKKSGYVVDKRTVHFLLKMEGVKEVEMGVGDERDGGFVRELREV
jgi:amidase